MAHPAPATMAFAPHSGWAAAVVLGGSGAEPRVLARTQIEMADPRDPESRQPYHAVEELAVEAAARRLHRYMAVAERMATAAMEALLEDVAARGHRVLSVGILDSSGRKGGSLAAILASHALIHTADGDHFRQALSAAAAHCRLAVSRVAARDLEARATAALRAPAGRLRDTVKGLGREVGPPWGADQKAASLLAWLLLAGPPAPSPRRPP
ncbi:MAG TPA: hypothetical protein VFO85_03140 [Vicinamibacteria bacterium]|nr:hypothetical protein [Vicinamibacteria bacterium]